MRECTHHATLAACYQLAQSIGFALGRWDRGGGVGIVVTCHADGSVLAGYRKALVGIGWAISLLFNTNRRNRHRNHSSVFVGAPFLALQMVFSRHMCSLVREP